MWYKLFWPIVESVLALDTEHSDHDLSHLLRKRTRSIGAKALSMASGNQVLPSSLAQLPKTDLSQWSVTASGCKDIRDQSEIQTLAKTLQLLGQGRGP